MKRGPFLGAAAAAVLSGCGGRGMGTIPGGVERPVQSQAARSGARMVPTAADPIPANVLASPLVGEARRFDGAVAPNGWFLARGQTLSAAEYPKLGAILDHTVALGKKQTFALPSCSFGVVIAFAGLAPESPQALAASRRAPTLAASLGPGARPAPLRVLSAKAQSTANARAAQLRANRELVAAAISPRGNVSGEITGDESSRIEESRDTTRSAALQTLSPTNRARVEALAEAIASGRDDDVRGTDADGRRALGAGSRRAARGARRAAARVRRRLARDGPSEPAGRSGPVRRRHHAYARAAAALRAAAAEPVTENRGKDRQLPFAGRRRRPGGEVLRRGLRLEVLRRRAVERPGISSTRRIRTAARESPRRSRGAKRSSKRRRRRSRSSTSIRR